jgi:iron(III) transport system substrate-binding protein
MPTSPAAWRAFVLALLAAALAIPPSAGAAVLAVADAALIGRARAEGTVTLYGSISQPQIAAVAKKFEDEFGIKVQTLRGDNAPIVGRIVTELRAGRPNVDVIDLSGLHTDDLVRQGVLAVYRAPENADLLAGTVDPHGYWSTVFLNTETIAYNPGRVKALGLKPPADWNDLAGARWHGQFGMYIGSVEWFLAMRKFFGAERGTALARAYAANAPRMIPSHSLSVDLTAAGELAAAANAYGYDALESKQKGQPVDFVNPDPTVIELHCISIAAQAPHPNAARLLERWWLSRPTQLWVRDGLHRISARKDVQNDPRLLDPKARYVIVDPADSANAGDAVRTFNAIFSIAG